MDGRPNRRNKDAFSNFCGVVDAAFKDQLSTANPGFPISNIEISGSGRMEFTLERLCHERET